MDGYGWLLEKRCTLMKKFGMTPAEISEGVTGAQGWVYYLWATDDGAEKRRTPGFIRQDINRRLNRG